MRDVRGGNLALAGLVFMVLLALGLGIGNWGLAEEGWRHQPVARWSLLRLDSMAEARHRNPGYQERWAMQAPLGRVPTFVDVAALVGTYDLVPGWGLSWSDYDLDGDPDLLVSNHMHFPSALYVNQGGLFFRRSRSSLGREIGLDDHIGVWADYDGDGRQDLATANGFYRPDRLFQNTVSSGFRQVGGAAGVDQGEKGRGRSVVWADLNGDGWHDLLLFNLMSPDIVYQNRADGTFSNATSLSGLRNSLAKEGGIVADFDGDGDLDVYVTLMRERQRNLLYLNRGDGVFVEGSAGSGADVAGASYSSAVGDYDNDGDLDLYVARANGQRDVLLRNGGNASFEDVTQEAGISVSGVGVRNAGFADLNNDGHLDLYTTRGGLLDGSNQANVLLLNCEDGTFREITAAAGAAGPRNGNSASLAFADFNGDGLLDIAATNGAGATAISGPHSLLLNRGEQPGGGANWLSVLPRRSDGSGAGQGARVEIIGAEGQLQSRVSGLIRTMAQDAPGAHFGLGTDTHAQEIRVEWPDGRWERLQAAPGNSKVEIEVGRRPHALQSHPAALLGEVPSIDLDGVRNRLTAACPGVFRSGEKAGQEELRRRYDAVLAWAMARDLDSAREISERDLERTWQDLGARTRLSSRVWVEQIAVGHFTMFAVPQPVPERAARFVAEKLQSRMDVLALANKARIRAWDYVFAPGSATEPLYGEIEGTARGYVEQGWLTPRMAWERYGPFATTLMTAPANSVVDHLELREGRDVQPLRRVWPLRRSFRVVTGEGAIQMERELFDKELRRMVRARKLRQAIAKTTGEAASDPSQAAAHAFYAGVRFSIPRLAAAARRDGLDERSDVLEALRRAEHEADLDHGIVQLVTSPEISESEIQERWASNRQRWTVPERVRGVLFFFTASERAEVARDRLTAGVEPETVASSMGIPSLDSRRSRANTSYVDTVVLDRALAERILGPRHAEEALGLMSGETSGVMSVGEEHYLLTVADRLAAEVREQGEAWSRARVELQREGRQQLLDYLLQDKGPPSRSFLFGVCPDLDAQ